MMQPHPLYIVASSRPRAGKTLLARLLIEFFYGRKRGGVSSNRLCCS